MTVFLFYFLVVIEAICSFLLLGVILIQRSKGGGMGVSFGGGMGEAIFGAQMGNVLTKTTVILAIIFLVNTTLLAMLGAQRTERSVTDSVSPSGGAVPMAASEGVPGGAGAQVPMAPAAPAVPDVSTEGSAGDMPVTFGVPPTPVAAPAVPAGETPVTFEVPPALPAE